MSAHTLVDVCLWIYAGISFVVFVTDQTRKVAPKRNRALPAPSPLCERTPKYEERLVGTVFAARQGN